MDESIGWIDQTDGLIGPKEGGDMTASNWIDWYKTRWSLKTNLWGDCNYCTVTNCYLVIRRCSCKLLSCDWRLDKLIVCIDCMNWSDESIRQVDWFVGDGEHTQQRTCREDHVHAKHLCKQQINRLNGVQGTGSRGLDYTKGPERVLPSTASQLCCGKQPADWTGIY